MNYRSLGDFGWCERCGEQIRLLPHHCDPALEVLEVLRRFVDRGRAAQAAVDQIIGGHAADAYDAELAERMADLYDDDEVAR